MLVALFLIGLVVIVSFWAALSFIVDEVAREGKGGGTVLMFLGTGCSLAMWIILWIYLGILTTAPG